MFAKLAAFFAMLLVLGGCRANPEPSEAPFLTHAEINFARSFTPPEIGWQDHRIPDLALLAPAEAAGQGRPTVWLRMAFTAVSARTRPMALFIDRSRENYQVWLNGIDLYRTDSQEADSSIDWSRPQAVPLPTRLLRPDRNVIAIRFETTTPRPLAIGDIAVGPVSDLRAWARVRTCVGITGPEVVTGALLMLSATLFLLWLGRRRETFFLWLAMTGLVWTLRNLLQLVAIPPFWPDVFQQLKYDLLFLIMITAYGFVITFLNLPGKARLIRWLVGYTACLILLRYALLGLEQSDLAAYLLMIPCIAALVWLAARHCIAHPEIETAISLAGVVVATVLSFHDLGQLTGFWTGAHVLLMPYGGLILFTAFGFALGRRMLHALASEEANNETLAAKVEEVRAELARSEEARQRHAVSEALISERMRLMREIHDGVGSRIMSAIAVARTDPGAVGAVRTLRQTMTDLRIAIDSLEPVAGDVVTLVANFRHRIERDLADAGLRLIWRVGPVPPLTWLDADAALNILRILQEAISNILAHAAASTITCTVNADTLANASGVSITIADDGIGFDSTQSRHGRGIENMKIRAHSMSGHISCISTRMVGTSIKLWLPFTVA